MTFPLNFPFNYIDNAIIDILVNNWSDIYGGRNGQVYLSRSGDWSDDFYLGNCDMAYRLTVYEYIDEEGQGHNAILSFFVEPAGYEDENGFDPVLH